MATQLFRTKKLDLILKESEEPGRQLKRTLGALDVTALGIGAIIGAGIFAMTGTAAAGSADHLGAGPALSYHLSSQELPAVSPRSVTLKLPR